MITKEYFNLRLNLEVEGDQRFVGAILIQVAYRAIGCLLGELPDTPDHAMLYMQDFDCCIS